MVSQRYRQPSCTARLSTDCPAPDFRALSSVQTTLADSFLADFEGDEAEEENAAFGAPTSTAASSSSASSLSPSPAASLATNGHTHGEKEEEDEEAFETLPSSSLLSVPSSLSPLLTSGTLAAHVASLSRRPPASSSAEGERDYQLLSASIRLISAIDSETQQVHRFLRELYSRRYAELAELVPSPVEYARVLLLMGNLSDDSTRLRETEKEMQEFLPNTVVLTISVTAATAAGRPLTDSELSSAREAAQTVITLHQHRTAVVDWLQASMTALAPNLTTLAGSTVAAQLVSVAGGLRRLSEIPACNLQVLGARKLRQSGLSSVQQELHIGIISQTEIMRDCPTALRRRAARLLAGKVALAARVDEHRQDGSGETGRQLLQEVREKIERWQQPPPSSLSKALPAPLAQSGKRRRGGKRYRKEKERTRQSELSKQRSRIAFGKEELIDDYTGEEFGSIGQEGSGTGAVRVREATGAGQKLSSRLSKDMQRRLAHGKGRVAGDATVAAAGGGMLGGAVTVIGGGGGGTASSIAFTPVQGMELVNNEHKRLRIGQQQDERYFANTAAFVRVGAAGGAEQSSSSRPQRPPVPTFS